MKNTSLIRVGFWQNRFFADLGNPRQNPPIFILEKSPTIFCRGARPKNTFLAPGKSAEILWKFAEVPRKFHRNDPFPNDPISDFPDPPTLASLEKKEGKPRKRQGFFSSRNP